MVHRYTKSTNARYDNMGLTASVGNIGLFLSLLLADGPRESLGLLGFASRIVVSSAIAQTLMRDRLGCKMQSRHLVGLRLQVQIVQFR